MTRSSQPYLASIVAFSCYACTPQYPPPPGFVDACYGGDFAEKLNGATPKFTMKIRATETEWPKLAEKFKVFGSSHDLSYFDTSVTDTTGLRMINVHLCSPKGIWVSADKRLWENGPRDPEPDEVPIFMYVYNSSVDWISVAKQFEASFHDWPGDLKVHWLGTEAAPNTSLERTRDR